MQRIDHTVEAEFEGKTYSATYYIENAYMTVQSMWGIKSAKPGPAPQIIAEQLLSEILKEAKFARRLS